jgi:hypothetical protein
MSNNEKPKPKLPTYLDSGPLRPLKKPLNPYALDSRTYGDYIKELEKARNEESEHDKPAGNSGQTKS